ncbi:MAG TPA: prepilin-type cleavage/methylation domain-containing protein [Verrucomicrobiae bacterium]|nr:prepilin-type cleavage/methylation domain-containing protein [Verrucomicrobiae bacterium]
MALPNRLQRKISSKNACINNLRQLDGATQQWILESGKAPTNKPTWSEIKPYLGRDTEASLTRYHCPEDSSKSFSTSYILGSATVPPRCKINPKHKLN